MADERLHANKPGGADDGYQQLRRVAALGYQLRAALVASDRFLAHDDAADRETAGWLVSCGLGLAQEVTADIDGLAKTWKPKASEPGLGQAMHQLRIRAHQLQAATKAADHFLDQDSSEDQANGSWLVACALGLADKLAGEAEDLASAVKRGNSEAANAATPDVAARRAAAAAAAAVRGATTVQ